MNIDERQYAGANAANQAPPVGEFRGHWAILLACTLGLLVGPHALVTYTAGVYYTPLEREFGWTRSGLSFAQTIVPLVFALTSPLVGYLNDRIGAAKVVGVSLLAMTVPLILLSQMTGSIEVYWLLFGLVALAGAGATTLTFSQITSAHFIRNRGLALGIALCGTGLAALIGPPLVAAVVTAFGWRVGYLGVAGLVLASTPFIVWPIMRAQSRKTPSQQRQAQTSTLGMGQALGERSFWLILIAFPLIAYSATGLIIHYVPMLVDRGLAPQTAAAIAATTGIFMIVGRVFSGYIVDRVFAPWFAAGVMLAAALALGAFAVAGDGFAWLGGLAIGLSIGAEFDLMAFLIAQYFGMARFGRIYGVVYALTVAGAALSPLAFGAIRDATGSYQAALFLSAALLVASAVLFLLLPRGPRVPAQR